MELTGPATRITCREFGERTMTAIPVNVRRATPADLQADLARVRKLAVLMDANFTIAGYKFGWDAIIGLIPAIGDAATALVAIYPIIIARKHKLGRSLQLRMAANVFIDFAIGEIPLL